MDAASLIANAVSTGVQTVASMVGLPPGAHWQPIYRLIYNGKDVTSSLAGRLLDLTLRDQRGFEADQLDITLDDSDGALPLPAAGATLDLAIGWQHIGLIGKGTFKIDDVEHSGAPDTITIRARAANMAGGLTTKKEVSWHKTTVGTIVQTIAVRNQLTPKIHEKLGSMPVPHMDQANESDANFLTRLAEQHDAIASVKDGKLLFMPAGFSETVSGKAIPTLVITRSVGDQHRYSLSNGQAYNKVKAYYYDVKAGKRGEVVVDKNTPPVLPKAKKSRRKKAKPPPRAVKPSAASEATAEVENMLVLRHTYASQNNAERAAQAALAKAERGKASFSITLARGNPLLFPETPAKLLGFKNELDGDSWIVTQCTHTINGSGYTTQVECEVSVG